MGRWRSRAPGAGRKPLPGGSNRISARVSDRATLWLSTKARTNGCSVAEVIRGAIEDASNDDTRSSPMVDLWIRDWIRGEASDRGVDEARLVAELIEDAIRARIAIKRVAREAGSDNADPFERF